MIRKCLPVLLAVMILAVPVSAARMDSGSVYCFRVEDFGEDLTGICLTKVPESVMLGDRMLRAGDVLTADQAAQMTFAANTELDSQIEISYLPVFADRVEQETTLCLSIRGKEDKPPVAEDSAMETYKNLANTGKLKVHDPEGQQMTFTVVRGPKRGDVEIKEDGSFTYTPRNNKVGVDSFVYTASDPAGKVSREATVTVTILKPSDATRYTDTMGRDCCFAAEWMKNTGIFTGEALAGHNCFLPEKSVSRGEFVSMLVKALDIPVEEELTYTGYEDEVADWLKPYLAAAVRSGLTSHLKEKSAFGQEEPITGEEAAAMVCGALNRENADFLTKTGDCLTREQAAVMLYEAAMEQKQ